MAPAIVPSLHRAGQRRAEDCKSGRRQAENFRRAAALAALPLSVGTRLALSKPLIAAIHVHVGLQGQLQVAGHGIALALASCAGEGSAAQAQPSDWLCQRLLCGPD